MSEQLYRVAARSKLTDWNGKGPAISKELAEAAVKVGNLHYPQFEHWVEPVLEEETEMERARR